MIGQRLGPYEVLAKLGEGGMGEVYRARDTRLKRDVAIKVLPASVADDASRLRRFEQEALATAALNHPNILVVFDIGHQAGTTYVVEELLQGQTLREVMNAAAMPVRKAVDYATQIAHGLSAAHASGIVHRDLKPENLFVSADGHVKILDFGLAKVAEIASSRANETTMGAGTEPGMVLGTIGYMAPEQVRGVAVDHRADIFSFGAVLYEMLTGRRAFKGDTPADTLMAILKDAPADPADCGRALPVSVVRVVERCLDKQPAGRFQSASDLAFALQTLASASRSGTEIEAVPAASTSSSPTARHWLFAVAGLVLGVALAAGAWRFLATPSPQLPFLQLDVEAPAGWRFQPGSALSPDGSWLVFRAVPESGGKVYLWIRELRTGKTEVLPNTEQAESPFWKPDSGSIGFFAKDRLLVVNRSNGRVEPICDARGTRKSGTWNNAGVIVFSAELGGPLSQVDVPRKTPCVPMPDLKGFRPFFLPDGRHFVFAGDLGFGAFGLFVSDLDSRQPTKLRESGAEPKYAAGHLLFLDSGALVAQPFDLESLKLTGTEPVTLAEDVVSGRQGGIQGTNFSVTEGGLLEFHRKAADARVLAWYQRSGTRTPLDDTYHWGNPALSPNDEWLAVERSDARNVTEPDIWLRPGSVSGGPGRMLASGLPGGAIMPHWRDREHVRFVHRIEGGGLIEKSLDGVTESLRRYDPHNRDLTAVPGSITGMTPDGGALGFTLGPNPGSSSIFVWPAARGERRLFGQTPANDAQPALSPSGRWLAYVSTTEDKRSTVWIEPFPDGGMRTRVSGNISGVQPVWNKNGVELYYVGSDRYLYAVDVHDSGGRLGLGSPKQLFPTSIQAVAAMGNRAHYDATRDGSRFIVAEPSDSRPSADVAVHVVVNWISAIKK